MADDKTNQPADTRKLCTCDGAGRGPGRACVVKSGGRLGELWRCADGASAPSQPPTCGQCMHATWQLTPKGNPKRTAPGHCSKEKELLEKYTVAKHPPCITVHRVTIHCIWPDYDASGCPIREAKPA